MKYGITRRVANCVTFIELSHDEFNLARSAKENLMHALYIEEKINYVLENFVEFERELLNAAVDNVVFSDIAWSKSVNELHTVNRRIVNLLAACRLYLDQVAHNIHAIYGRASSQSILFRQATSDEYETHLGYRVMEAMRNYVQHRGFPVHLVTRSSKPVETAEGRRVMHTVIPNVDVSELAADAKFKASILQELQEFGNMIDLRPLIREFVSSIGRIHVRIREMLSGDICEWEATMTGIITRLCDTSGEKAIGIVVVAQDESGAYVEQVNVFEEFMTRRQDLERKSRNLTHYGLSFVTSGAK